MDINIIKEMIINSNVESIIYVGKVKNIAEIYYEMLEEGYNFFEEDDYSPDGIIDSLEDEDIIAIGKNKYRDGEVEYFVQEIFNDDGEQLYDDSEVVLVDEEIADELELDKFENGIITLSVDEEDYKGENELDEILGNIVENVLDGLSNDEVCPHCLIKEVLSDLYELGYNDAVLEIKEKLNDMDDLLL